MTEIVFLSALRVENCKSIISFVQSTGLSVLFQDRKCFSSGSGGLVRLAGPPLWSRTTTSQQLLMTLLLSSCSCQTDANKHPPASNSCKTRRYWRVQMRSHSQGFEAQRWSERSERPLCSVIHISFIITTAILSSVLLPLVHWWMMVCFVHPAGSRLMRMMMTVIVCVCVCFYSCKNPASASFHLQ